MRIEHLAPRTISAPLGGAAGRWWPWAEVSLRLRVDFDELGIHRSSWVHWAAPLAPGGIPDGALREFDPGARAAVPGEPAEEARGARGDLDERAARDLVAVALERSGSVLHLSPDLGLVSEPNEGREAFRRRCLSALSTASPGGVPRGPEAAEVLSRIGAEIRTWTLSREMLGVSVARVGVGWYAEGTEPRRVDGALAPGRGPVDRR